MAVIRVEKSNNYTVMSNYHLKEKEMSLKAKGLLSLMLSLPDDWDYSISGLESIIKENATTIRNVLGELEMFGYLMRERIQNGKGQFEYLYTVYEKPHTEKPHTEKPHTEKP
ncbi:MAG: helix-turn-helix domain-containing protein, partial [Eubacterium sp.]